MIVIPGDKVGDEARFQLTLPGLGTDALDGIGDQRLNKSLPIVRLIVAPEPTRHGGMIDSIGEAAETGHITIARYLGDGEFVFTRGMVALALAPDQGSA